jgi:type IV pilus assembly protein PilM
MHTYSLFAKLFPPPRFMTLPTVGVDISDSSVKYILLTEAQRGYDLTKWGDIDVPEGTIVQGVVKDIPALARILAEIKDRVGTPYMRVSLPEERAYLFQTSVPAHASHEDIVGAIEFHLEENVPLSPRDAYFDFEYVPTVGVHEGTEKTRPVTVTVYGKETVNIYFEACKLAGVVPTAFEIEPEAIAHAVTREGNEDTVLIIDFGKSRTGIGIVEAGSLMFTSTVDVGGLELDAALKLVNPNAGSEELIRLKNEAGLLAAGDEKTVREALLKPITVLKNEVASRISYWNSKEGVPHIQHIVLCGGIANLAGLPEYFSEQLGVETMQADIWQNVFVTKGIIPPITKRYSFGYATAVGLALGGFMNES